MTQKQNKTFRQVQGPQWSSGQQVWHLITDCHLCVGSTLKRGMVEVLSQYDPGC